MKREEIVGIVLKPRDGLKGAHEAADEIATTLEEENVIKMEKLIIAIQNVCEMVWD